MNEKEAYEFMDSARNRGYALREFFFPVQVAEFISELASSAFPKRMLDPWAGMGVLAAVTASKVNAEKFDAIIVNEEVAELAQMDHLNDSVEISVADGLLWLRNHNGIYDAIVSSPPFGMRTQASVNNAHEGNGKLKGDYSHLLLHESCKKLNQSGLAAFVLTQSFLFQQSAKKVRASIEAMGVGFKACISLPVKTFYPHTNIPSILVVFEQGYGGPLFVAQYSEDKKHQQIILNNLKANKEGSTLSQGHFVDADYFNGYEALESSERLEKMVKRMGLNEVEFGSIILETRRPKAGKDFERLEERPNSVYLPLMATTKATTSQSNLPEKLKSYVQLVIDPDKATAVFVAGLLNTPLGQSIRDRVKTGTTIPRIRIDDLLSGPFYLPTIDQQKFVASTYASITRIRSELNELEQQLWNRPKSVKDIARSLTKVNKEDRFEDWVETLPFPLASILWRYHGNQVKNSARESCETLIHFFEALGEFVSTIHLSAIASNEEVQKEWMSQIKEVLDKQGLSIEMATFGTWKCLLEFLSSRLRKEMNDKSELYFDLYRTKDRAVLEMLLSKRLVGVLQKTNLIRNASAHGGAVNDVTAQSNLLELQSGLDEVRACFGESWLDYELIDPRESRYKAGITHYKVRKIVGTRNAPFKTDEVSLTEQMEDGQLHLYCPGESRALPLLPFIKVMHSPKTEENACYFYNRRQSGGIRYLSYHFATDSEVVDVFEDVGHVIDSIMGVN